MAPLLIKGVGGGGGEREETNIFRPLKLPINSSSWRMRKQALSRWKRQTQHGKHKNWWGNHVHVLFFFRRSRLPWTWRKMSLYFLINNVKLWCVFSWIGFWKGRFKQLSCSSSGSEFSELCSNVCNFWIWIKKTENRLTVCGPWSASKNYNLEYLIWIKTSRAEVFPEDSFYVSRGRFNVANRWPCPRMARYHSQNSMYKLFPVWISKQVFLRTITF